MTKNDLQKWMLKQIALGNSIPMFVRGGGMGWLSSENEVNLTLNDDDYFNEVVTPDEEDYAFALSNFRAFLTEEELKEMQIVEIPHRTGFNQENFDMFFCFWDF